MYCSEPFMMVRRWFWWTLPGLIPAAVFVAWHALGSVRASGATLPRPELVAATLWRLLLSGEMVRHAWVSLGRALGGLLLGGTAGLVLGLLNGYFRLAERLMDTSVQMVRNIPHLALMPLIIIMFGLGEQSKVFLVALGVLFPLYANTFHGVRSIDPGLLEMGRVYGLSAANVFRHLILPGALPSILVGLRYALGTMWLTLIVAETMGADAGIGYMAMSAREFMQTDVVLVSIVLYALLGKLADSTARALERRWVEWDPGQVRRAAWRSSVGAEA
jgi:sulfonate transport system permease protein